MGAVSRSGCRNKCSYEHWVAVMMRWVATAQSCSISQAGLRGALNAETHDETIVVAPSSCKHCRGLGRQSTIVSIATILHAAAARLPTLIELCRLVKE